MLFRSCRLIASWKRIHLQDAMSRHRGAKPRRRCELLGEIDGEVWHLDVGSSHPGGEFASKGWAVRPLKRYASWVQNVVRQFGPYLLWRWKFEESCPQYERTRMDIPTVHQLSRQWYSWIAEYGSDKR